MDLQLFAAPEGGPPSPRKRRRAREEGRVPRSADLSAAAVVAAGGLAAALAFPRAGEAFARLLARAGEGAGEVATLSGAVRLLRDAAWAALAAAGPVLAASVLAGVLAGAAQVGLVWTARPLAPRWERIDPVAGLRRIFSARGLWELARGVLKLAVLVAAAYGPLRAAALELSRTAGAEVASVAAVVAGSAKQVFFRCVAVALVLGVADYAYQRWEWERSLAMTPQEVKEELRETEGDPQVRARLRRRQRELSRRRMLLDVRRADVVVTNPVHLAVALRYDPATMPAPVVVAKGRGAMARLIRAVARRYGIPWVEDRFLAQALYAGARVGEPIPPHLYAAVAEVLAFVWRLQGRSLAQLLAGEGPGQPPAGGREGRP